MIPTDDRHLAHQHALGQWRRTMRRFFLIELPMALRPAFLLLAGSMSHLSWWLLLPASAKAGLTLAVSAMVVAVWVTRLPLERPAIYSLEVDTALVKTRHPDPSLEYRVHPWCAANTRRRCVRKTLGAVRSFGPGRGIRI